MEKIIQTKEEVNFEDLKKAHPNLLIVFAAAFAYCCSHNLPFVVTSLFTDLVTGRITKTHSDGRAFDLSVKGWNVKEIEFFISFMNYRFKSYGAISAKTGKVTLIPPINHGTGPHLHLQVAP